MSSINHIRIPVELFKLPFKGIYEMSVYALVYNFKAKGLRQSNDQIAKMLDTSSRTVERAIARLRKRGLVDNKDGKKSPRCLIACVEFPAANTGRKSGRHTGVKSVSADNVSVKLPASGVVTPDMTADHKRRKESLKEEGSKKPTFSAFVDYWNSKGNLPGVKSINDQRQNTFQVRMGEPSFAGNWQAIIDKLSASSFATGTNDRNWKADIDWVLKNSANYAKVLEGKYDDRPQRGSDKRKAFTPAQEQTFLEQNTHTPTESEAEQLMRKVGLL